MVKFRKKFIQLRRSIEVTDKLIAFKAYKALTEIVSGIVVNQPVFDFDEQF